MDKQKAKILCDLLRSSSAEKVVRGLREIKKRLLTYSENLAVFRQLGLIPQTLKLIQRPNEDILNGALSILSASCADDAARVEVFNAGGVPHLLNVLKCAKSEPLQMRSCRTVANQAQHKPSCDRFVKLEAITLIIEMLNNCKEDETKLAAIRALRLFANCGENCQKIVMRKGIHYICKAGFTSSTTTPISGLTRATIKAIAHFSRISHSESVSQIMEGTDHMILVSKLWDCGDQEIYECVVRVVVNVVASCFEYSAHRRDSLDARVLDRLCTASAPTIIVAELKNRRVAAIEEEKLILALCKFCEGSNECNNLTAGSFSEPPTFLGRAWMQLIECGGVALLVSLLLTHRENPKLRPAILRAILGVEHNYSYRDTILKHFLAAKLLPQLVVQFDELMAKYMEVRRESLPGCCVHTISALPPEKNIKVNEGTEVDENKDLKEIGKQEEGEGKLDVDDKSTEKALCTTVLDHSETAENIEQPHSPAFIESSSHSTLTSYKNLPPWTTSSNIDDMSSSQKNTNVQLEPKHSQPVIRETTKRPPVIYPPHSPESPGPPGYYDPRSPGSLSCSPHSFQSGSNYGSPTWSPAQDRSQSPTSSPQCTSLSNNNPLSILLPLSMDSFASTCSSPYASPPHSPIMFPLPHSPIMPSPPRSTSPIRVPSDWEYEEEEDKEQWDEDGRFSPTIPDLKGNDGEENMEETEEEEEEEMSRTDGVTDDKEKSCDSVSASENEGFVKDIFEKLIMKDSDEHSPSASEKRPISKSSLDPSGTFLPREKRLKLDVEIAASHGQAKVSEAPSSEIGSIKELSSASDTRKTPFKEINKIKFRLGNPAKRHLPRTTENKDVYTPYQNSQITSTPENEQQVRQQQARQLRRRSSSTCSTTMTSDLTPSEAQKLALLELVVRVISQVAHVKEAIKPVCRDFVPRIMTYLSSAQVINKAATRMLATIARNPLCIQPLLDSNFIPYVGVELGEAGNPESPSGCPQCTILSEGSAAFLEQMVKFFNHIHQYGQCEVSSRLQPFQDPAVKEGCIMALPHVTRCPKLLHDFLLNYPAIEVLMRVLRSDQPPNNASYMYATAAISRLATMLQLENQFKPVRCEVCLQRGTHTKEEVTAQLQNLKKCGQKQPVQQGGDMCNPPRPLHPQPPHARPLQDRECKFEHDKIKDITFKLKDGSCVLANREFLAERNEVLSTMLMGSFSEGSSSCIDLAWKCKASVEELIHFLYNCECDVMGRGDVKAYIELIFMSQMYMMEDLRSYASHNLISSINGGEDIISIYESGVGRIDENIILQALCNALVKPMKTWKRARWLKELFQSEHAEDIDHNIRMIIHHPLDMNRLVCNCDQSLSLYRISESDYRKLY